MEWGLFQCTQQENVADMVTKGRSARGERVNTNKLTGDQIREIRELASTGQYSTIKLAHKFGISWTQVKDIISRKSWKWLE